jgi:hypothetical protein
MPWQTQPLADVLNGLLFAEVFDLPDQTPSLPTIRRKPSDRFGFRSAVCATHTPDRQLNAQALIEQITITDTTN